MFRKVLIANRGEIALRVARACREMGIATVAVYSLEDRDSAVVRYADEAVRIGPASSQMSYLNIPAVVEAALRTGAEAIHPGYGLLSENPDFAEVCVANGIAFVGPPPEVLESLGDKSTARTLMRAAGLPLLPGSTEPAATLEEARSLAEDIGWPIVLKAVAGGGGRGITVVREPDDLATAYRTTRRTAAAVFGDDRVYVERYLDRARHVEVQVLCDAAGNAVHLGERDCSVQRRHQKLVEESPAPGLPPEVREEMCAAAVRGARAVGYVGAGTFEFLVDDLNRFYFMEINCRVQVEHPVTEMVSSVDIVQEQLRIAAGESLRITQDDVRLSGAAIECRINAENPDADFVPAAGRIDDFEMPAGPFVRVDTHAYPGYRISVFYDSLLAKVVVWAPDRAGAVARMRRALSEVRVTGHGVRTTTAFLDGVMRSPEFAEGTHDIGLVPLLAQRAAAVPDTPVRAGEPEMHHA
ncbi:acetyl-CoA carboxylase biotin carboxylase subunit [Nucisporomicrobium flavum]|uniref:acetyl-CoA carboxylase biotin carboxylase subunit n=1 Tax=Nucisporomicrobium flavum TaxID=2785915 RepID=UPI003C2B2FB2